MTTRRAKRQSEGEGRPGVFLLGREFGCAECAPVTIHGPEGMALNTDGVVAICPHGHRQRLFGQNQRGPIVDDRLPDPELVP